MRASARTLAILVLLLAAAVPVFAQRVRTERFQSREVVSQEIIVRFRGAASAEARSQSIRNEDTDIAASSPIGRSGAVRLRSRGRNVAALIQAYSRRADVEYAEPNFIWKATDIPNDSFFGEQWALQNTGQVVVQSGTAGADIRAVQAWDIAEGSRGIVVGMIDSGIDYTHPDLLANMWSAPSAFSVTIGGQTIQCAAGTHGFNAIARTCDPMDDEGHGTHTAGVVGASGNNAVAVSGVSRVANMMALKFLDSSGQGTTVDAIAAIEFAIQVKQQFPAAANVRVLNNSWGGIDFSQALLDEINLAGNNDMLFVVSAGNSSVSIDATPEYPAAYDAANLIAVAATDNRDQIADFSNFGAGKVHLGAPGVEILSTLRGKFYGRQSGTSESAPMVSGAAALILSACSLNTSELKSNILSSVDAIPALAGITVTGGRLNVNNAIRNCVGALPGTFTLTVNPFARTIDFGHGDQFSVLLNALNGFASAVTFSATNLPAGMSAGFTPNSTVTSSTTLSVDVAPDVVQGTYLIGISATGGGATRTIGILVTAGVPATCVIDPAVGSAFGSLDTIDAASLHRPPAYADYCSFTPAADRAVDIEMRGGTIDSYLYLLSSSGSVIASDDNGLHSGGDAVITAELFAGTYTIEATTANPGQTGQYSLQLKSTRPNITSVSPNFGTQGTNVNVTVTGTVFFGQPISVKVFNCPGVTVTNTQVISSTTVTATLTLPNNTGNCNVVVANAGGDSNSLFFTIYPPIPTITGISPNSGLQGQTVPITISGTNFVSGLQLLFNGVPNSITSVTATAITANLFLNTGMNPGVYNLSVSTSGGISNSVPFTVLLAPPTFTKIYPSPAGGPGLSADVVLTGSSFVGQVQVITGDPKITVSNLVVRDSNDIEAKFNVASDAPLGDYPIRISTAAGISGVQIFKVAPPPVITSFTPDTVFLGRTTTVALTGTNLYCYRLPSVDGTGVIVGNTGGGADPCANQTNISVLLDVSTSAATGPRTLTISTPNGTTNPVTINILRPPPEIQSITPLYAAQGTSVAITINGSNLSAGSVGVSGSGVVSSNVSSTGSVLTATLTIASNAAVGARNVTITTPDGTSSPVVFSVTPPTWPDLTIRQTLPAKTAGGFDEVFALTVRNDGEKENLNPITVTDTLSLNGVLLVSGSAGWACSMVGSTATCTTSTPIAPHSEFPLGLTLTMTPNVHGFFTNTVNVISAEDYNISNNTADKSEEIVDVPVPQLVSPAAIKPGQQATLSLTIAVPFFHDLSGTLNSVTLTFTPSFPGAPMDPAVQFSTGGQQVSYIIRANTLVAEFQGTPGPIGFQGGTVAGGLTFTAKFKAGANPLRTVTSTTSVLPSAPAINSVSSEKTSSGFVAVITMLSSTREVRNVAFQFNTTSPIQLSCGGLPGCINGSSGSLINFNLTSVFNDWYAGNSTYGSLAVLRVPFSIQGTLSGSISVTMTNSLGNSNTMSFTIP